MHYIERDLERVSIYGVERVSLYGEIKSVYIWREILSITAKFHTHSRFLSVSCSLSDISCLELLRFSHISYFEHLSPWTAPSRAAVLEDSNHQPCCFPPTNVSARLAFPDNLTQINISVIVLPVSLQTFFEQPYCAPPHNQFRIQIRVDNIQHCNTSSMRDVSQNTLVTTPRSKYCMSVAQCVCTPSKNTCNSLHFCFANPAPLHLYWCTDG